MWLTGRQYPTDAGHTEPPRGGHGDPPVLRRRYHLPQHGEKSELYPLYCIFFILNRERYILINQRFEIDRMETRP